MHSVSLCSYQSGVVPEMFVSRRATSFEASIRKSRHSLILLTENSKNHYVKYVSCPELLCQSKLYNKYIC